MHMFSFLGRNTTLCDGLSRREWLRAGWHGDHADPWLLTCDANEADFRVPDIGLPAEISPERFSQRKVLRSLMNHQAIL